ncbi:MAG: MBL fold metallo-hydrolase [Bradymonadaceae bacterium]|nr:MBL fold metallo-hydrolase [Lujinxingiaceae bacterium]
MQFYRIYDEDLGQASYLVGCTRTHQALVVDPRRDVDIYLETARRHGLTIAAVAETHVHADFLSGARELAHATGATLYLSEEGDARWKYKGLSGFVHVGLVDNDTFFVGDVRISVRHTPGHTPEHLVFLITDPDVSQEPMMMLSGDFVFVEDLGRPDLLEELGSGPGQAKAGAEALFESLRRVFLELPAHLQIWPGHGAGSACGKSLSAIPVSTVAYELKHRWWGELVRRNERQSFADRLLAGQPEAPLYFAKMKQLNRDGMTILGGVPLPTKLTPGEFGKKLTEGGALLVDTRSKEAFATRHLKASFHVPYGYKFSTWAGWMLPYYRPLILLAATRDEAEELMRKLLRIGHDDVIGYITDLDDIAEIADFGSVPRIDADEAFHIWEQDEAVFVDVRSNAEYDHSHIPGAVHVFAGRIIKDLDMIPRDRPVVVHCSSGNRSSIAASALLAHGFDKVINFAGGFNAWKEHIFPEQTARSTGTKERPGKHGELPQLH